MKKISRRKFISATAQGAAGLSIIPGCTNRTTSPDIRPPSAPEGLDVLVDYTDDGTPQAFITWNEHNLTDINGSFSETGVSGYNIYRWLKKDNEIETYDTPINDSPIQGTSHTDIDNLIDKKSYKYRISALDMNHNESPLSTVSQVKIERPSIILKATNTAATSGSKLNADVIKTMVHSAIKQMQKTTDTGKAFESLFSKGVSSATTIAIKINCLANNGLCTHPEVVNAIIDGLTQMLGGTFPLDNITVFDDRRESYLVNSGFPLKNEAGDYKVITLNGDDNAWNSPITVHNSIQRFAKIVDEVDYIINVPVLKNHNCAGITFALKNFFGIIDKPGDMHDDSANTQETWCDPYIAEVYKKVADKVALIIGDAIFGAYSNGPATPPNFILNTILAGTDPVAMDMVALKLINDARNEKGLSTIPTEEGTGNASAQHIITASSDVYQLGRINKKIVEVSL